MRSLRLSCSITKDISQPYSSETNEFKPFMPDIQNHLAPYIKHWNLTIESESITTTTGILVPTTYQDQPAMLKLLQEDSDESHQSTLLDHYQGNGMVALLDYYNHAILIERCIPGTDLSAVSTEDDSQATTLFCDLATQLHATSIPKDTHSTPIENFSKHFKLYLASDDTKLPEKHVRKAFELFQHLVKTQDSNTTTLLHGDLHHYNIIQDQTRGWLAIDPKGYIGEACYEVGAYLRNPIDHPTMFQNATLINNRIQHIHQQLNYPKERIKQWAYTQLILACIWAIEDNLSCQVWIDAIEVWDSLIP